MSADSARGPRIAFFTAASLVAFAANSLLARAALIGPAIDPTSFTALRLTSGAVALALVVRWTRRGSAAEPRREGSWPSALALFGYALGFSLAYLTLSAGTGALLLFAAVQATMVGAGLVAGERPGTLAWIGLAVALAGLVYLVLPGLAAPHPAGAAMMLAAGVCWGVYSLRGRSDSRPARATAGNFARSAPLAIVALAAAGFASDLHATPAGVALALVSGVVTSGLGYVVWYAALGGLSATVAAIVQLLVPVLAALGGVALLAEPFTPRLAIAGLTILGGVAVATLAASRRPRRP